MSQHTPSHNPNAHNDIIVGLAGHIDHGKTTLIKALNGFDGDSLKEEKERGITLDLSFSSLALPSRNVAFIDVPGHHKLVKNMIAGSFGIDVLLLVVAADDGLMPQSHEHIQIANMLGISRCICVISKVDKLFNLAHSNDEAKKKLTRLKEEITELFSTLDIHLECMLEFGLEPLPHLLESNTQSPATQDTASQSPTQSPTQSPLPIERIKNALDSVPKPPRDMFGEDFGLFLYYIDRSFSIQGAGCVVTGSVISGRAELGQSLYIYDLAQEVSVKGIQIHDRPAALATPSHRVALNLTSQKSLPASKLKRGYLISQKGFLRGFDSIDVGIFGEVEHNATYTLHLGSSKAMAKLTLLGSPLHKHAFGERKLTLATLKCDKSLFSVFGQKFILRDTSGQILGGVVLNPIIDPIKKQGKIALLHALAQKDFAKSFEILSSAHKKGFGLVSSTQRFCLSHEQSVAIASKLSHIFVDEKALTLYPLAQLEALKNEILDIFTKNKSALLSPFSLTQRAKWVSLALAQRAFDELLSEGFVLLKEGLYLSKNNKIDNIQSFVQNAILDMLTAQHFAPLAPYNIYDELLIDRKLGDSALKALSKSQKVVRLAHNLFITTTALNAIVALMREIIAHSGYVDVNLLKERTGLSRKYLISYLEYLDRFDDIITEDHKRKFKYAKPSGLDSEKPTKELP